ncbi:MAG: BACON domain-containing protein, partial [Alistipes sp.]|nr:BACON domain-containing protein [Alistipes sp.]
MKNIFRSILLSAVALTAGFAVSCTDPAPENGHYEGTPTISVSPASVTVPLAGGTTEAITVITPAEWTLTIDAEDVVASTTAGNGDGVVTFEVPAVEAMRTIKVTFTATGYVSGFPITKKASVSISQTDTEVPSVDGPFVYYDNCGEAVSKVDGYWPYVDAYAGWNPTGGEGFDQSGVTYTGKNASVRNSGKTWAPVGATYATDAPYAYLQAKTDTQFVINNINIKSGVKNYTFSFTAFNQYASLIALPHTPVVAALESGKNLTVEVSVDGQNWGAIAFTTMPDGNWTYAIAPFTLPADADKLFVRFSGYKADTTTALPSSEYQYQAALRFDDFRLVEGGEGPVVDFNNAGAGGGEVVEGTIESILAGGEGSYSLKNAWVVATYGRGCLITDASGKYILCYMGSDKTIPAVGAVVDVNGAVTTYAGLLQFGDTAVVTATGETKSVDHGTAATMTGADLDAYVSAPAVKYASFEGALAISGNYYNVTVEGASTAIGSLSYPAGEIATQLSSLNGKGIKVTGYLIGVSSGKYTNMMVTAVSATGDDPEVPEAKTATMINKIASLTAGNYFMAAFLESYDTYNWAANPYHCWTGKTSTSNGKTDLETISYSYTDGVLAPGSGVLAYPAVVTLEAVDGKANTYYIKVGDNYLTNASAANRQLALGTTKAEWVAADQAKGGIIFTNNGATFGTANATKAHIRSYTDATSLAYGVVFFTTDGTV